MDYSNGDLQLNPILAREMHIRDIESGGEKIGYVWRFRGQLTDADTAAAYDRLDTALTPHGLMPLFRLDGDLHVVLLVKRPPKPKPSDPRINFVLFLATVASVFYIGVASSYIPNPADSAWARVGAVFAAGGPFTLAIMAILLAHEFGHYLVARYHKVNVSLPYLIPMPFISPFGTMGAFISMKEQPKNRRQLLEIGLAGPLAGMAVTILVLLLGLMLSPVQPLPGAPAQEDPIAFLRGNPLAYFIADLFVPGQAPVDQPTNLVLEGNSPLYLGLKYLVHGQMLPAPQSYDGMSPVLYWLRYFFTGQPLPYGGVDVSLNPLAWAGWFGLLITGLNLIPAGQLDGGHAIYVLLGRQRARLVAQVVFYLTLILGIISINWWLWAALIRFFGRFYAEPRDEITPLDGNHKALAIFGLVLFLLVFIPVPLTGF
jgi:membrane-associated protease RseP (regulator of RpoE activity)